MTLFDLRGWSKQYWFLLIFHILSFLYPYEKDPEYTVIIILLTVWCKSWCMSEPFSSCASNESWFKVVSNNPASSSPVLLRLELPPNIYMSVGLSFWINFHGLDSIVSILPSINLPVASSTCTVPELKKEGSPLLNTCFLVEIRCNCLYQDGSFSPRHPLYRPFWFKYTGCCEKISQEEGFSAEPELLKIAVRPPPIAYIRV